MASGFKGALEKGGQFLQRIGQRRQQRKQEEREFQQKLTLEDLLGGKKEKRAIAAEERLFKRQQDIINQKAELDAELDQSLIDLRKAQTEAAGKRKGVSEFEFIKALSQSAFNIKKADTDQAKFNKVQARLNLFRSVPGGFVPIEEIEQARRIADGLDREEKFQLLNFIGIIEQETAAAQAGASTPSAATQKAVITQQEFDRLIGAGVSEEEIREKSTVR